MKRISFTITLYGWSDLKKWFWDQFCFPRRKIVSDWLDYHNSQIKSDIVGYYYTKQKLDYSKTEDMYRVKEFEQAVKDIIDKQTKITKEFIMAK